MHCVTGKRGETVCVSGSVCVCRWETMQMSITFTEIMLFSALLSLNMPKNLNSTSFEGEIGKLRMQQDHSKLSGNLTGVVEFFFMSLRYATLLLHMKTDSHIQLHFTSNTDIS